MLCNLNELSPLTPFELEKTCFWNRKSKEDRKSVLSLKSEVKKSPFLPFPLFSMVSHLTLHPSSLLPCSHFCFVIFYFSYLTNILIFSDSHPNMMSLSVLLWRNQCEVGIKERSSFSHTTFFTPFGKVATSSFPSASLPSLSKVPLPEENAVPHNEFWLLSPHCLLFEYEAQAKWPFHSQ